MIGHMDRGARKQNPQKNSFRPVASAPTHSTQNIASKPAREQERAARPTRRAGHAERDGTKRETENSGRPKEEVPKKIKARASAWRNKRNKNRKWRQYKDQSKRGTKMERQSPILTTQESLRYRAETELESCYAA